MFTSMCFWEIYNINNIIDSIIITVEIFIESFFLNRQAFVCYVQKKKKRTNSSPPLFPEAAYISLKLK